MTLTHVVLISALFNLVLGFYTWKTNKTNFLNISFGIFTITVGIWGFLNYLFQNNPSDFLLKTIYGIGPFIIVNGFVWIHYLSNKQMSEKFKIFLSFLYSASVLIFISMFFNGLMIANVTNALDYQTGPYFLLYSIFMAMLFIGFIIYIFYIYKVSNAMQRTQLKYISYGMGFVIFVTIIVSYILPVVFNFSGLNFLDSASTIFFTSFAFFSISKYQLLSIKVMITEVIVYFLLIAIFTIMFLAGETGIGIRIVFLIILVIGSYFLVNSVKNEIKQKDQLQELSTQLEQANAHLKELDAMKTEFVSLASHELLTPVSAIEGYLSMLLDEKMARVDDPKALKYLNNVYSSAKRLARLIADMLNISRIEEGRLLVEKADVDMKELIEQVVDEVKFKADERKQKIVFEGIGDSVQGTGEHLMTYGDSDKIKEVTINIIGNAIKYSRDPGTITITVQTVPTEQIKAVWTKIKDEIKARPLDDQESIKSAVDEHYRSLVGENQLLISIKDQGIGIPVEELPRLFKKFHRVGNYSTQESQGTGLGLYISRALTELQHGRIWADSEGEGKGSTFSFTLPVFESKPAIVTMEKEIKTDKEQLKPLAKPMKMAEEL